MKIVTRILMAVALILVIASIGIYFMPNKYTVTSSVDINKPVDVVFGQVADFNNWSKWSPYYENDPKAKETFEGTPATTGHKMIWDGEKRGLGGLTTKNIFVNQAINNDFEMTKPFAMKAKDIWKFDTKGGVTTVTWISQGGLPFPIGRVFGITLNKRLSEEQKHGLDNLKKYSEGLQDAPAVASTDTSGVKSM